MRRGDVVLLAAAAWIFAGCSSAPTTAPAAGVAGPESRAVRITQFYTTSPKLARGEKALLCYGTDDARKVWLSPPRQELSPALAQCVEVSPAATTTYTLTAEGDGGQAAKLDLTVTVGPPRARIVAVTVSTLEVARGQAVSLCYEVENATQVRIDPIAFGRGASPKACTSDYPLRTTTYVVTATGAGGDRDQERVTVRVK
jgi:hypothetical protein